MKSNTICCIVLILYSINIYSQDQQWLILDRKGKSGFSGGVNQYNNFVDRQFILKGIKSPNLGSDSRARNDIFVIYTDGTHYNSRFEANPGSFYNALDLTNGVVNHNFNKNTTGGAKFLFLTNRYEGDDLPTGVTVVSGNSTAVPNTYQLQSVSSPPISANHNVVFDREVTVIVDYDYLDKFQVEETEKPSKVLKFDGVERISDHQFFYNQNILDLKPVFLSVTNLNSVIYPNQSVSTQTEEISLDPSINNEQYRYVNFKTNVNALSYGPDINGKAQFNAIFSLYKNGQYVTRLPEPLMFSFDPNYLQVMSICALGDGSHIITYHLEFENTSDIPENKLSAEVTFPPDFDLSCLVATSWNVGGTHCPGDLNPSTSNNRKYIFKFRNTNWLVKCTTAAPDQGKGYVEFKVKVNSNVNVADLNVSLQLNTPLVYFNLQSFPITDFRDLTKCLVKGEETQEPPGKPIKGDSNGYSKKGDKPNSNYPDSSNANKLIIPEDLNKEPKASDGNLYCFRPITQGDCDCKAPPRIWLYAVLGLAALGLLYFLLKKKKVTQPPSTTP